LPFNPWKQFVDALGGMIGQRCEEVGEPGWRINIVEFACLCRSQNYAEWLERLAIKSEELRGIEE
jgi:hypothetical protein